MQLGYQNAVPEPLTTNEVFRVGGSRRAKTGEATAQENVSSNSTEATQEDWRNHTSSLQYKEINPGWSGQIICNLVKIAELVLICKGCSSYK